MLMLDLVVIGNYRIWVIDQISTNQYCFILWSYLELY